MAEQPKSRPHTTRREREPIMHRTAPEAAPMIVGRASAQSGSRGRVVGALAMLVIGLVATVGALIALGSRVMPTATAVRDTELDPVATYFMGTSSSVAELVLVIGLMVLVPVGIVLAVLGYRRLTDDGPSLAAIHVSNSPNSIINQSGSGAGM